MIRQRICKHIAKAPRASVITEALSKSLQSQPKRRISKFLSHAKKKKIKTRQHSGYKDRKENKTNDKFNMKVQFDRNPMTDKNRQCITKCICHKGFIGYASVIARSNFRVGGQETTTQSLTAHTLERYAPST